MLDVLEQPIEIRLRRGFQACSHKVDSSGRSDIQLQSSSGERGTFTGISIAENRRAVTPTTNYPTRMDEFDSDYCRIVASAIDEDQLLVPGRILANLRNLESIVQEFAVDQLVHSLQTATRAERAGESVDVVVGALCHDMAKTLGNANHDAVAGEMVRPYLNDDAAWMVAHHQDFQGRHYYHVLGLDPEAREQYRGHPAFDLTARFADDYDQLSFDPSYESLPLEHFVPMVREVFSRMPSTVL